MTSLKHETIHNKNASIFLGHNTIQQLKQKITQGKQLLIITGKTSARKSGALKDLLENLETNNIQLYDNVSSNPTINTACEIASLINDLRPDSIVAIGGGSVIDAAKTALKLYNYHITRCSDQDSIKEILLSRPPRQEMNLYTINLTHGTGSEANSIAVITFEDGLKIGFRTQYPVISIDDPKYTLSMPHSLIVATSIDALAHAIEAATSLKTTRYVQLHSLEAAHTIIRYLPRAVSNPQNPAYRYWLLYASSLAGISIDYAGTHLPHILENAMSGIRPDIHHGAGLILLYRRLLKEIYKCCPRIMSKILSPLDNSLRPIIHDAEKAQNVFNRFIDSLFRDTGHFDIYLTTEEIRTIVENVLGNKYYRSLYMNSPLKYSKDKLLEILIK